MGTPVIAIEKEQIAHSIDLIGQELQLYRFPSESLGAFRRRVLDTYIHKGNDSTRGLIANATRALGSTVQEVGMIVNSRAFPSLELLLPAPGIEITNERFTVFSNFLDRSILKQWDIKLDIPGPERPAAYYMKDIIDWFDSAFEFSMPVKPDEWLHARGLLPMQNWSYETLSLTEGLNKFNKNLDLIKSSIYSDSDYMTNQVSNFEDLNTKGDYWVDAVNSVIHIYQTGDRPSINCTIAFVTKFTFLDWSPVSVSLLSDPEYIENNSIARVSDNNESYEYPVFKPELWAIILETYMHDRTYWFNQQGISSALDINRRYRSVSILETTPDTFSGVSRSLRDLLET